MTHFLSAEEKAEYTILYREKEKLEQQAHLRQLRHDVKKLTEKQERYVNNDKEDDMIEVGKVVIQAGSTTGSKYKAEESIRIIMDQHTIGLGHNGPLVATELTSKQAVELAQLLMKAAECQTEYAVAAKELEEQKKRLDAKYKDMISGLGLENPDLQKKDLTKLPAQSWSGVNGR